MSWDSCFQLVEPHPVQLISHPEAAIAVAGYRNLHVYHPGYENLVEIFKKQPESLQNFRLDTQFHWVKQMSPAKKGEVKILIQQANTKQPPREITAYCKIVHCLDPIRWMKGKYEMGAVAQDKNHTKRWERTQKKLNDPMNQAYVEALACYLLGKCREADTSPHFSLFYGSLYGLADSYNFNMTEDFQSFRNYDWFWHGKEKKWFDLQIESSSLSPEEKEDWIQKPDHVLSDSYSVSSSSTKSSILSSDDEIILNSENNLETNSIGSMKTANLSFHSDTQSNKSSDSSDNENLDDDDEDDTSQSIEIAAEFHNFPVLLMFLEKSEGTMDDLLNDEEFEPQWEKKWAAWIFQVIAGLCVLQHQFSMTHNDLHTNNIVWTKTSQQFLYYKNKSGSFIWKVPTYGKLMRIIDFGRAIFRIKDKIVYSDDFVHNNDAGEQYNFGPFLDSEKPVVTPNPSFDLCRLAVSLFESLYSDEPQLKENGEILSSEPGLEVRETNSDLFNCMWKWMVTDSKENVLVTPDGDEKYPDFDLYKVISTSCHNAVPKEQLHAKPFSQFLVHKPKLQAGTKVYNLFC